MHIIIHVMGRCRNVSIFWIHKQILLRSQPIKRESPLNPLFQGLIIQILPLQKMLIKKARSAKQSIAVSLSQHGFHQARTLL